MDQLTNDLLENATGLGLTNTQVMSLFGFTDSAPPATEKGAQLKCKAFPGTPEWPAKAVWEAFDKLLNGALIETIPLAAPCFNDWPSVQNNITCASVTQNWPSFRYQ